MKRRRKAKKGISKKPQVAGANDVADNTVTETAQENLGSEEFENDELDSEKEAESPPSLAIDVPEKPAAVNSGSASGETAGQLVYRRVKVKIKASKTLESQLTSSDAPTQSDTDKSGQGTGIEKMEAPNEKMEDSANSLPDTKTGISGHLAKSPGSIKIKGFDSSSVIPCSKAEQVKGQAADQKPELTRKDPQFKKQELDAALEVIKKVMKMDAAEPFNVPVDPIALGIPDYFDVINTPMDFGTICSNLEGGTKYMNSEDVYRDVRYIWDNCYKYNNKGDYVLELMKRVKKNFTKYWTGAGLFCDHSDGSNSGDAIQTKDVAPSMLGKIPMKTDPVTTPAKKSHGLRKHKDGCMCAICVMMRRRQEREETARMLEDQTEASDDYGDQRGKDEETSLTESPGGEYTSADIDISMEHDGHPDLEAREEGMILEHTGSRQRPEKAINEQHDEMTGEDKEEGEISEQAHSLQGSQEEENKPNHQPPKIPAVDGVSNKANTQGAPSQHGNDAAEVALHKTKETMDRHERAKMYERLRHLENPKLFELCGTLFDEKNNSVWSGPHSLVRKEDAMRRSAILSAVTSFMR